jgi:hypothetical protein
MAKKAQPKKNLDGTLIRNVIDPGPGEDHYPLGRSTSFEDDGYHSNPSTGMAGNTKHSKDRYDYPKKDGDSKFFPVTTKGK